VSAVVPGTESVEILGDSLAALDCCHAQGLGFLTHDR
jgi:hypothetical protein